MSEAQTIGTWDAGGGRLGSRLQESGRAGGAGGRRSGTSHSVRDAERKSVRNHVVFREVNEHIAELAELVSYAGLRLIICECSDVGCVESLEITAAEYERVRAGGARFAVVAGHELPEFEQVVESSGRFLVVETIGAAASIAYDADPRSLLGRRATATAANEGRRIRQ